MKRKMTFGLIAALAALSLGALGQTNGEWTVNRIPGTNRIWTAERSGAETAAAYAEGTNAAALARAGTNAAALAYAAGTNGAALGAAGWAAGTNGLALARAATNTAALAYIAGTNGAALGAAGWAAGTNGLAWGLAGWMWGTNGYAVATGAVGIAGAAGASATNALAVALAIRAQNEYPAQLWTASVPVPMEAEHFGWLDLSGGGAPTAMVHHVYWPTNIHWYTVGAAALTNVLTDQTNELWAAGGLTNTLRLVPDGTLPKPLAVISGASDSWEWDQGMGLGITNRFLLTAVTNAGDGVTVYLGMTNRYTGYLYASTNMPLASYTGMTEIALWPAVGGVTGVVSLAWTRGPASTNAGALASDNSLGLLRFDLEQEALAREYYDSELGDRIVAATNAVAAHTNRADNPHGVTAAQAGAPSVAEMYALMSTSRVERVWASDTNWVEYAPGTWIGTDISYSNYYAVESTQLPSGIPYPMHEGDFGAFTVYEFFGYYTVCRISDSTLGTASISPPAESVDLSDGQYVIDRIITLQVPVTNSVTYYLPTNLVPAETWGYAEMTNWMADGNAGQVWVTGLSYDSANGVMNTHLHPSGTAHDDRYVKLSGGVATNVTLAGTVTVGGVGRTSWPEAGGGTTIYSAVTNLPLVASGETNRVTLYSDRSVYVVTATNAVNALTNINGNLVLTGNKADWELWVNFTNPAGTNMLWCPCMRFDIAPEITVTGLYKFACSTLDGATVSVKQIYPTVIEAPAATRSGSPVTPVAAVATGTPWTVVTVTPTNRIYRVALASPAQITNAYDGISFNGSSDVSHELWLDFQTTNALSTVFATNITFSENNSFTVTGLYKLAISTCCGLQLSAAQSYPKQPPTHRMLISGNVETYLLDARLSVRLPTGATTTSFLAGTMEYEYPALILVDYVNNSASSITSVVERANYAGTASGGSATNVIAASTSGTYSIALPSGSVYAQYAKITWSASAALNNAAYIVGLRYRRLNSVETAAFYAGWRP